MSSKIIKVGPDDNGNFCLLKIHLLHAETLSHAYYRVKNKNWDYVCVIAGLPGSGKSTLARTCAKFVCPWFDLKHVAFTADEFVEITNNCKEYSAVVLDESFESLNSRTTMTPDFMKVINHLQLIRQKHLFIFLCLPNFFDLAKNVAIFRASHLFVTYATDEGDRGRFLAFDRDTKRKLFVKGMKYMDYNCVKANYIGDFWRNKEIIDEKQYDEMKASHLKDQEEVGNTKLATKFDRNKAVYTASKDFGLKIDDLQKIFGLSQAQTYKILKDYDKYRK